MKTKKRFFSILLALVLMLGLMPGMSLTAYAEENWSTTNSLPTAPGEYKLTANVNISGTWEAPSGNTVIDMNGHNITKTGNTGNVINVVTSDSNLTLKGRGTVSGGKGAYIGNYRIGGCVYVNRGVFILDGPTISGNNSRDDGHGVFVGTSGSFKMISGTITGNTGDHGGGGGVAIGGADHSAGTFEMTGGTIENNTQSQADPACAIRVNKGICKLSGGIIKGESGSADIYMDGSEGTLELRGNPEIESIKMEASARIKITGTITYTNKIGITINSTAAEQVFTNSDNTSLNDTSKFKSENASYAVGKNAAGQLFLGTPVEVTYKVANGTWSDDTTADKKENVASGTKLASVPTGMKASEGYTGGSWDTDPATATITEAKTFTYTFTAKQAATITNVPTAKSLTYNGSAQELVTAGTASGGTMQYALGTATEATEQYTTSIPTATNAGTYYVWYKAKGNEGYSDSDAKCVTVKIAEAPTPTPTPSGSGTVDGRGGAVTTEELKKEYGNAAVNQGSSAAKAGITSTTDAIDALQNEDRKVALLDSAVECGGADVVVDNAGETRSELVTSKAAALAAVLTPREMVEAVIGNKQVKVILEVQQTQAPDDQAKSDIESKKDANEQVVYINVNLFVEKNGNRELVTEAKNDLKITFVIPESIRGDGRTFRLIWSHKNADGTLDTRFLDDEDSDPNTFTVSVNKLSTVGLTYTTGSVTPTYTPSYTSGSTTSYSSSSSGSSSGGGGGSSSEALSGGKSSSKAYYAKLSKNTVEYLMPKIKKNAKKAVVPAKVKIGKKTYKVTSISGYTFVGNDNLRTVKIGKNVKRISPYAFYGCGKLKTLNVNSKFLTAKKIKGCLKGSAVNKVLVMKRAVPKLALYKKIFAKKNTGAPKKVSVKKKK